MQKSILVRLIYRVILCVVSAFACLLSLGIFYIGKNGGNTFSWGFLKYYTNLSNYFVFVVSAIVLHNTVKSAREGGQERENGKLATFKFMTVVMILVTFLVVIFLLQSPFTADFWLDLGNMSYHFAAPLLFIFDYFLFDKKRTLSVFTPLLSLVIPLVYVGYIFLLGAVIPDFAYPYFFLDVHTLGYGGVCLWVLALLGVFTVLGYLLWFYNRLDRIDGKWRLDLHGILRPGKAESGETDEEPAAKETEPNSGDSAA